MFRFGVIEHISLSSPVEFYSNEDASLTAKLTACDYTQVVPEADAAFPVNILLAHMFFDKSGFFSGDDQNLTADWMKASGYDMAFLGHDHEEYVPEQCGKTIVVRSGSLLRGTSHNYNFVREPGFIIVDDIFKPGDIRKAVLPFRPYKDIISQSALNRKNSKDIPTTDTQALRDLAERLAETTGDDASMDDIILKTIETDPQMPAACRKILLDYIHRQG